MYLEGDFDYDVNVQEAVKPDNPLIRQELLQYLSIVAPMQGTLIQDGVKLNLAEIMNKIAETFDTFDARRFLEELDPSQQAAFQVSQALQQHGGTLPPTQQVPAQEGA